MSDGLFYRLALARDLTPGVKSLFQSLLARAERLDGMQAALPDQILANRSRREARPVTLSKSAQRAIRLSEKDAREAAEEMPALVSGLPETLLVRSALESERAALSLDQIFATSGHPEDQALARPLVELRAENIAELEAFLAGSRTQAPILRSDA
jgi:hypothetical protein